MILQQKIMNASCTRANTPSVHKMPSKNSRSLIWSSKETGVDKTQANQSGIWLDMSNFFQSLPKPHESPEKLWENFFYVSIDFDSQSNANEKFM